MRVPGCVQNLLPYLSPVEQVKAQAEIESAVERAVIEKADAIRERKEMRGDIAREFQREELASREAQRGSRTC
jgi:hypothetical protein